MKKQAACAALLILILFLGGCGEKAGDAPAAEPTASPAPTQAPQADTPLSQAVRALMDPYQDCLAAAAQKNGALTYSIPGDMLQKLVSDARAVGVQPQEGRYRFTWRQSGEHTYSASAMQIADLAPAEATPDPLSDVDPVLDNQQMGDFSATGGGMFDRSYDYDVAENLSEGKVEIAELLNGEITGQELFTFLRQGDELYFSDGILDMTAGLDGLEATEQYLVAAGVLRRGGLDIIEFTVPGKDQVPRATDMNWNSLLSSVRILSRVTVP